MAQRMLRFMGPALLIPLGDPLMTLTDTVFIGRCCSTSELAALAPSNIIFGFSQYVFQALQVAAIRCAPLRAPAAAACRSGLLA